MLSTAQTEAFKEDGHLILPGLVKADLVQQW